MTNNAICWSECTGDSDCDGSNICCPNNCGDGHCVVPLRKSSNRYTANTYILLFVIIF